MDEGSGPLSRLEERRGIVVVDPRYTAAVFGHRGYLSRGTLRPDRGDHLDLAPAVLDRPRDDLASEGPVGSGNDDAVAH